MGPHVFHVVDGALTVRRLDVDSGRFVGEPIVLARGIVTDPYSDGQVEFAVGAAGSVAYVAAAPATRTLRVVDARGNALMDLASGDLRDVRVSPDGTRVAYEQIDHATGGRDIWVAARAGGAPVRVSRHPGHDVAPTWSPDGGTIYYLSHRAPQPVLVSISATGEGAERVHFTFDGPAVPYEITRDGRGLLYEQEGQETGWDIWVRPLAGGAPAALVRGPASEQNPALSPDGRWLAYSSPESQGRQVYIVPVPTDGRRWRVSKEHGRQPLWNTDGTALYYHGHDRLLMRIPVDGRGDAPALGAAVPLFPIPLRGYDMRYHYGVFPDGPRFLVNVPPALAPPVPATVILNARLP
jgi:dipeptidyl aminopeptidase/acylaminoacyl peptidase